MKESTKAFLEPNSLIKAPLPLTKITWHGKSKQQPAGSNPTLSLGQAISFLQIEALIQRLSSTITEPGLVVRAQDTSSSKTNKIAHTKLSQIACALSFGISSTDGIATERDFLSRVGFLS